MSRDRHRLQAFVLADDLVLDAYRATKGSPARNDSVCRVRSVAVLSPFGFVNVTDGERLKVGYGRVIRALQALVTSLRWPEARGPRSEAPYPRPLK